MNSINSLKNYEYSFLVRKTKKIKKLKKWGKKVSRDRRLYILLIMTQPLKTLNN